eukprot:gene14985-20158_t
MLIRKLSSNRLINIQISNREREIVDTLSKLVEPITDKPLLSVLGLQRVKVQQNGLVDLELDCLLPGYHKLNEIESNCRNALSSMDWISKLTIKNSQDNKANQSLPTAGVNHIKHIIGVSSCKGGVGKSTVAMNLAVALYERNLSVGLLDADVYGPSLPLLLPVIDRTVRKSKTNPTCILPLLARDYPTLKLLSFGFVNSKAGVTGAGGQTAAVLRGPIVSKVINQLLLSTEWGHLDYLIVDMPPGTGDIQITLSQSILMSGAVIVTTPHTLSLVDAAKGVLMFEDLKIPTLAVVENMSYFECEHGKKYYPFGEGGRKKLLEGLDIMQNNHNSKEHVHHPGCGHDNNNNNNETNKHPMYKRLQTCPLHSIPLDVSITTAHKTMTSSCNNNNDNNDNNTNSSGHDQITPNRRTSIFSSLVDDVLSELFLVQLNAIS